MIRVLPVGSRVTLGGDVLASVTGIFIRANDLVWYEVAWWNGLSRQEATVQALEVSPVYEGQERVEIGFVCLKPSQS